MVHQAEPSYRSSGIIDLYHTETHPQQRSRRGHRRRYRSRQPLISTPTAGHTRSVPPRQSGVDPGELERRRGHLSQVFVEDFNRMAHEAYRLVVCFDTVELLQNESWVVEERARLDEIDSAPESLAAEAPAPVTQRALGLTRGGLDSRPAKRRRSNFTVACSTTCRRPSTSQIFTGWPSRSSRSRCRKPNNSSAPSHPPIMPAESIPIVHRLTEGGRSSSTW